MEGFFTNIHLEKMAREWIEEDIPSTDVGGAIVGSNPVQALFYVKSPLVIAGFPFVLAVAKLLGCTANFTIPEGEYVQGSPSNKVIIGSVSGLACRVLQIERTVLEVLVRCSACATYARKCVENAKKENPRWKGTIAATRKTTPGSFRLVEKYGAIIGGADPHRYSLSSMVMLKDNHIDIAGGISDSVKAARKLCGFSTKIEVECRTEAHAIEACKAGADVVMLDNFSPKTVSAVAKRVKKEFPHVIVEASGGIKAETIGFFALEGIDVVSIGNITHGPPPGDISLKISLKTASKM
eukprot:Tbor_TRINITY_DN3065_c0_g1::TRINITY_DN3065_c0_g1_i1::g.17313::m.17313/K00767/nadC, QPRT; nicotinate-nucleotide pyrophosphorylase (carboxylating)